MNILIVEDDAITLRRLQHFLEKWDHHVITAVNGADALEKFLDQDVELGYHLGITEFHRSLHESGLEMTCIISFDLMKGMAKKPCDIKCTFIARYTRTEESSMTCINDSALMGCSSPASLSFSISCTAASRLPSTCCAR